MQIKKYNSKSDYSYTLGAFPTVELIRNKPCQVISVFVHPEWESDANQAIIIELCKEYGITVMQDRKVVEKLRNKENCFVIGVFAKVSTAIDPNSNHIVLVNPSDMGNMGTIIRTCIGFGNTSIAVISPCVDIFHPKVIRSSMGAVFQANMGIYNSFEEYQRENQKHQLYPFMLNGENDVMQIEHDRAGKYSLIFGNEGKGLDKSFLNIGKSVYIPHSSNIDSLNLSLAVGIGMYEFQRKKGSYGNNNEKL